MGVALTGTVGNVSTAGMDSYGVIANAGVSVDLEVGNVLTLGADSFGVSIVAGSDISGSVGDVSTSGVGSTGVRLAAPGAITFDVGIVTTTGAGATGLDVNGAAGAIDITIAGADTTGIGVDIFSTSGSVSFNNTGLITSDDLFGVRITGVFLAQPASVTADCGDITVNANGAPHSRQARSG